MDGDYILHPFKRGDPGIDAVWPDPTGSRSLAGDELLKHALHAAFKTAVDYTYIAWPPGYGEYRAEHRDEIMRWDAEKDWAFKNLDAAITQLQRIVAVTDEEGREVFTKRGARVFKSLGKDDIALSHIYCYAAFLIWLQSAKYAIQLSEEDAVGFGD